MAKAFCVLAGCVLLASPAFAGDAGRWDKLPPAPYDLNNKQAAIAFADDKHGWYGNGTGRVFRTDDGGDHWRVAWRHPGTYVRALEFLDEKVGFLGNVGPGYFPEASDHRPLYVTHDGGAHWEAAKIEGPVVKGICAIDVLRTPDGVTVRTGGRVGGPAGLVESFDGGNTWRSRDMSAATGMILDIRFVDGQTGFIAGASDANEGVAHARILKTSDGGKTWRAVFESGRGGDNNWKLAFPSAKVGYGTIISYDAPPKEARGYVVKTEDGGDHWTPLTVTRDQGWIPYGINFVDESHGFVGGSTGGYETTDGGKTWRPVRMGYSVNKIRFVRKPDGGMRAFAIGQDVYRTELGPSAARADR